MSLFQAARTLKLSSLRTMDSGEKAGLLLPALFLAVLIVATYIPVFSAGFVFDDHVNISGNPLLNGPFWKIWVNKTMSDYWPLTWSTFWLEWRLWGDNAAGYHLVNLAGHIGVSVLLWRVLHTLKIPGAWLAALLFAVHPVTVESVAWITERKNVLSGVLYLAAILIWLKHEQPRPFRQIALVSVLFLLALLAKISVAMLPLVLLGIALYRYGRIGLRDLIETAPLFALALILGLVNIWFQRQNAMAGGWAPPRGLGERVASTGWSLLSYIEAAVAPFRLAFVYPEWPVTASSPLYYVPLTLVVVIAATIWLMRKRTAWAGPCLYAFGYHALMLLPVLGFIDIAYFMVGPVSNHLQYLALMGPVTLMASAIVRFPRGSLGVATVMAVMFCGISFQRARAFESDFSLWSAAVQDAPRSVYARNQMSTLLINSGHISEGLEHLDAAARLSREPAEQHRYRSYWLLYSKRPVEAAAEARKVLSLNGSPETISDAAFVLANTGQTAEAIELYRSFVRNSPNSSHYFYTLAALLSRTGQLYEAAEVLRDYCRRHPGNPRMEAAFGMTLSKLGLIEEARVRAAILIGAQNTDPRVDQQMREWAKPESAGTSQQN